MRRFWIVLACAVFLAGLILDTGALLRVGWYYLWAGLRAHPWWALGVVATGLALWAGRRWLARRGRKRHGRRRQGKRGGKKRAAGGARKKRARTPPAEPAAAAKPPPSPSPPPHPARGGRRRTPRPADPPGP